jgi:SAM-dependent methyltransferase
MSKNSWQGGDAAQETYNLHAAAYDDFTRGYMNERWTRRLLEKAMEAGGLEGTGQLLDIGCGTGHSFLPMLDRGWAVTGCDVSPAMIEVARSKTGDRAQLLVADMRELPDLGRFDLIWALNDSLNYLLSVEEFEATLAGMHRNLARESIIAFDMNTLETYHTFFRGEHVVETEGRLMVWRGLMAPEQITPGAICEARFEVSGEPGPAVIHRQRHFPEQVVLTALDKARLRCVGLFGELNGDLDDGLDEEGHTKAVYLCRRSISASQHEEVGDS